jgi:hypothetical protein
MEDGVSVTETRPAADAETDPSEEASAAAEAVNYLGSFALDPAGFLLFGPTVSLEFGSGRWAASGMFRWFDPGLLAHALFLKSSNQFAPSFGGGIRGRYYFTDGFQGFHAGVAVEFLQTNIETPASLIVARSLYVVPQAEGGYRFAWERFFVGPSVALGYAAQMSAKVEDMPGGTNAAFSTVENRSSVYGSAKIDLGVLF